MFTSTFKPKCLVFNVRKCKIPTAKVRSQSNVVAVQNPRYRLGDILQSGGVRFHLPESGDFHQQL